MNNDPYIYFYIEDAEFLLSNILCKNSSKHIPAGGPLTHDVWEPSFQKSVERPFVKTYKINKIYWSDRSNNT